MGIPVIVGIVHEEMDRLERFLELPNRTEVQRKKAEYESNVCETMLGAYYKKYE